MSKKTSGNIIATIALVLIAVLSMTLLNSIFSSPETYAGTLRIIDGQKSVATSLSIAVTATSTTLSALPDDTAGPIANELANLSTPLFIIVCILFLEKFLLTTFGWISCSILFPLACLLAIFNRYLNRDALALYIKRLLILGLALILVIPFSAKVTGQIQDTFSESVNLAMEAVSDATNGSDLSRDEDANAIVAFFSGLKDNVAKLVQTAKNMLGIFTDAIAVLLITSCIIPILTVVLFVFIIKIAFSMDIPIKNIVRIAVPRTKKLPKPKGDKLTGA